MNVEDLSERPCPNCGRAVTWKVGPCVGGLLAFLPLDSDGSPHCCYAATCPEEALAKEIAKA